MSPSHLPRRNCRCTQCATDWSKGCEHPHHCMKAALHVISLLGPKWNPEINPTPDNLSLTKQRRRFSAQPPKRLGRGIPNDTVTIYTDGSCIKNGEATAQAGSGIWYGPNDPRNKALRLPDGMASNQAGEIAAILYTTQTTAMNAPLHIINGLTKHLPHWEDEGWIGTHNAPLFQATAASFHQRAAITSFKWVKGHSGEEGNSGADELAPHLDITRYAILSHTEITPTDSTIWKSLQSPAFTRPISDFLWKCMHNALHCGSFWDKIPNYEHRSLCPVCDTLESIEHILCECSASGQQIIWNLTRQLWGKKDPRWYPPSLGTILGCGTVAFRSEQGKIRLGATRLYRILMSEAAYLIWKLRCEQRISKEDDKSQWHAPAEITNRWKYAINKRLQLDCAMTRTHFGAKALPKQLVLQTWSGTLDHEDQLPDDWTLHNKVLVGMDPPHVPST
ncbi:hypothetical protein BKA93DRAFT_818149 [Sparassis latifolia]